jgi:ATP-dependent DNA helicase RecG
MSSVDMKKLCSHCRPQNSLKIAEDYIEKMGTGIRRINQELEANGNPLPYFDYQDFFSVTFLKSETPVKTPGKTPVKTPDLILNCLRQDSQRTLATIADSTGKSLSAVERAAAKLVREGKLKFIGPAKGGHWQINE